MKTEQFKRCTEKLLQEYERSKGKHPDFDSIDRAWRAIQREYSECWNESMRDTVKPEALAMEMLHLSNVALQGYMFLMKEPEKYVLRDDFRVIEKENKAVIKEGWLDGVLKAVQAIKDNKPIQINSSEDPKKWKDYEPFQDGHKLLFYTTCCWYRAKPEPKMRALTPQEWLEALMAGKKLNYERSFSITRGRIDGSILIAIEYEHGEVDYCTTEEMLLEGYRFSDDSPCGVEVAE